MFPTKFTTSTSTKQQVTLQGLIIQESTFATSGAPLTTSNIIDIIDEVLDILEQED